MFKKRIRVAEIVFLSILVLTVLIVCFWKVSEKYSKGTGEIHVLTGDVKAADGVTVSIGTLEKVRFNSQNVEYFSRTRTEEIGENQSETTLRYEKENEENVADKLLFSAMWADFPQKHLQGIHRIKGNELSYDLIWYLADVFSYVGEEKYRIENYITFAEEDNFLYYYDGEGADRYEVSSFSFETYPVSFGSYLCEFDGKMYGYIGIEPEYEYRCVYSHSDGVMSEMAEGANNASAFMVQENWTVEETYERIEDRAFAEELSSFGMPEIHMKVNKGIYRFDEDGTATCVCPMDWIGNDFSVRWLATEEEKNTLTVIGKRGDMLLAYGYSLDTGEVEETVLWDSGADVTEWFDDVSNYILADVVTDGERCYFCYTDIDLSKVNLVVFEDGKRVFEGEVYQQESEFAGLDFSMDSNELYGRSSRVEMLEITVNN